MLSTKAADAPERQTRLQLMTLVDVGESVREEASPCQVAFTKVDRQFQAILVHSPPDMTSRPRSGNPRDQADDEVQRAQTNLALLPQPVAIAH
jgi:hypothetical protein